MTPRRSGPPTHDDYHDDLVADLDDGDEDEGDGALSTDQQETYLDEAALVDDLIVDADEVVGLDDAAVPLDDPADLLAADDERDGDTLSRWHDVGPAEDAVDPSSMLIPEADENGYTREGDALGIDGDSSADEIFSDLSADISAEQDAGAGVDLVEGLELPGLPALDRENDDGGALGPEEDADGLAAELLERGGRTSEPDGAEP